MNVLRVPVDRPYVAGGRTVDASWHVLARLTTSDETIGLAARELGEHLIGMSVLEPEAAWERPARRGDRVGPGGLLHCGLAPLDIAVWDAAGRSLGQPLRRLPGGHRGRRATGSWFCGHVVPEIRVHLLAAIPDGHLVGYVPRSAGTRAAVPRLEGGELVAPPAPGLGLDLDAAAVERHRVA